MPLPTGTVTFLFTDIAGSTQRWERHHDAMKAAIARYEQLMTAEMRRHNGYVFKLMGDAFCVAFPTAPDAVAAAVAAQLALFNEDFASVDGLPVRMGLHTGDAEERNADYFGPAVNRVARLMSIGHGGQVLLSGATRELTYSHLPRDVSLADLGLQRLKDLSEPEHVWQLSVAGLQQQFPPLKSLDELPNNLPLQPTSFRGREHDLEEVKILLGKHRVLTLIGPGGVGKTRLALQAGAELLDQFPDGVWLADISPISDPELVSSVVANALGMNQVEGRRVDESIAQWLKRKQLLLIIDNCEHLLGAAAVLTDSIHRNAPNVRILATSRQALGIAGEAVHRLPSLAVPASATRVSADDAVHYGAIAVFVDRATLADTRFVLSDDNAPIVAEICRHLDGIPLAIELAAARVKVLSIPNLAQRLTERFKILTGGSRTAVPRQKTLAALIDWSYDLLNRQEQMLFNRLAAFAGGFSLNAATVVCSGDGVDEFEVLDLLASLTDKSLVVADTGGQSERYHLLESTREYALEKLVVAGEREGLARRHAEYFRSRADEADERYGTASTLAWFADVEAELDNYRMALEWALTQRNDAVVGGAIAGALEQYWYQGGLSTEGRYWIGHALERLSEAEGAQARILARLWRALAYLHSGKRSYEASEKAIDAYNSLGDRLGASRAQVRAAFALYQMGRLEEAVKVNAQASLTLSEFGDKGRVARCQMQQAMMAANQGKGNLTEARSIFAQSLAAYKELGDELGTAVTLGNLGEVEFADGRPEQALAAAIQSLEFHSRRQVDASNLAVYHANSTAYRIALGDIDAARASASDALRYARQAQEPQPLAVVLQHCALLMALQRNAQSAARLLGYAESQYHELGMERERTEQWGCDRLMALLREQLSETDITSLCAEGALLSEDRAIELASSA